MDAGAQKTKQLSRRACYEAELARLKDSWPGVEGLKGEAYLDAQRTYSVEKRRIEQEYADVRRPGRPAKRRERPVSRVAGNGPMWARGLSLEITRAFMEEELDLSERVGTPAAGWAGMPELVVAERLRGSGARAADLRLLLTFTAAMDRAREADRLWFAAERLYRAEPWTFQPESVVSRGLVELSDALRSHGSASDTVRMPPRGGCLPSRSPTPPGLRRFAEPSSTVGETPSSCSPAFARRRARAPTSSLFSGVRRSARCGSGCSPIREELRSPRLRASRSPSTSRSGRSPSTSGSPTPAGSSSKRYARLSSVRGQRTSRDTEQQGRRSWRGPRRRSTRRCGSGRSGAALVARRPADDSRSTRSA